MLVNRDEVEKIIILPACWQSDALDRLSRIVDLNDLRLNRKVLRTGLEDGIQDLLAILTETELQGELDGDAQLDTVTRKHIDSLLELLQKFAATIDKLD